MVECPECAAELNLAPDVEVAEIVVCPDCGVELEVMKLDAELAKIPVPLITAVKDEENIRASLAAGCNAVLAKPLEKEAFARALESLW